jgi:hypothetical protein
MNNSTMLGAGITPEGINQNYVMYEFALERSWDQTSVNIPKWINQYTLGRYGLQNDKITSAWDKLVVNLKNKLEYKPKVKYLLLALLTLYFNRKPYILTMGS